MKFLFIILALASGWYCQAQETILKGHIRNYNGEEIFICYFSYFVLTSSHIPGAKVVRNYKKPGSLADR